VLHDVLIGALVVVAYIVPSVVFALALKPAGEVVQEVGRSTASV
jgi:hypothetical protein